VPPASIRALVKTGYAGTLTTQIKSGLAKSRLVVLADLSTALPTNTTNARRLGLEGGPASNASQLPATMGSRAGFHWGPDAPRPRSSGDRATAS
jgi:hypothetical protein